MLENFIEITNNVISEDGFEEFLPTLLFPDREEVIVLGDLPVADNHEQFAQEWIAKVVKPQENYLIAYRVDSKHFKVVANLDGVIEERTCRLGGNGLEEV
ncbi:MAG: hypothetical protein V4857_27510 [Pseudomonadota bacterium]